MFLNQAEALTEDEVDVSIPMEIEENLEDALKRAIDACVEILGVERPDAEKVGEALSLARTYTPKVKQRTQERKGGAEPRYYAFLPEMNTQELVNSVMEDSGDGKGKEFWEELVKNKRVGERPPHTTIVHTKSKEGENAAVWEECKEIYGLSPPPIFKFRLGHLLWDDRVMAFTVKDLSVAPLADGEAEPEEWREDVERFVEKLPGDIKERMHITVGTKNKDISPVEARDLVGRFNEGKTEGIGSKELSEVWVRGRLQGLHG